MATHYQNGANGAAHTNGSVGHDREIEAIAVDGDRFDALQARLASDKPEDATKLTSFLARSKGAVHR